MLPRGQEGGVSGMKCCHEGKRVVSVARNVATCSNVARMVSVVSNVATKVRESSVSGK